MKLSQAILKGCEISPRQLTNGTLLDVHPNCISSCALGAAYLGFYGKPKGTKLYNQLYGAFEVLSHPWNRWIQKPTQEEREYLSDDDALSVCDLKEWIIYHNDTLMETREEIAAKLDEMGL